MYYYIPKNVIWHSKSFAKLQNVINSYLKKKKQVDEEHKTGEWDQSSMYDG